MILCPFSSNFTGWYQRKKHKGTDKTKSYRYYDRSLNGFWYEHVQFYLRTSNESGKINRCSPGAERSKKKDTKVWNSLVNPIQNGWDIRLVVWVVWEMKLVMSIVAKSQRNVNDELKNLGFILWVWESHWSFNQGSNLVKFACYKDSFIPVVSCSCLQPAQRQMILKISGILQANWHASSLKSVTMGIFT